MVKAMKRYFGKLPRNEEGDPDDSGSLLDVGGGGGDGGTVEDLTGDDDPFSGIDKRFHVTREDGTPDWAEMSKKVYGSYREAEGKLGAFTGAPEGDYEITLPEHLQEHLTIDPTDPAMQTLQELFRKHDVSQEFFNEVLALYTEEMYADATGIAMEERAKLGPNADETLKSIGEFIAANTDEEGQKILRAAANSAASVAGLKYMIENFATGGKMPTAPSDPQGLTQSDIDERYSNPLYYEETPRGEAFRAKTDELHARLLGGGGPKMAGGLQTG